MMVIYVREDGVLGIGQRQNKFGVYAVWIVDGLRLEGFLENDEWALYADLKEGIDD